MEGHYKSGYRVFMVILFLHAWFATSVVLARSSPTKRFNFTVEWREVTRLCHTKRLLTVNGEYPGPTIDVHEGDRVEVVVFNNVERNTTIHWHGIKQFRTGWADGPAYITQCPIRANHSYTYRFKVTGQRGTLFWHAHLGWQRASVHGAFIVRPRSSSSSSSYPFPPVHAEVPIILGEWWNVDTEAIESDTIRYGSGPNVSDAYTINGMPGPYYPCSNQDTFTHIVEHGKTYMLRIINAALNNELFFAVENHTLTVVEIDAAYIKPFATSAIMIAPGQTTSVLVTTNTKPGTFMLAARPYVSATIPFNPTTTIGFISYSTNQVPASREHGDLTFLPPMRDTAFATQFSNNLRSLDSTEHPCKVPKEVDKRLFITISLNLQDCCSNCICKGFAGKRFSASMNNQSFTRPATSILESYFKNTMDAKLINSFPERPPHPFNYTGPSTLDMKLNTEFGMRLVVVPHGTRLEFVLQDTSLVNAENHPIHVHGHNFFVVGRGFGNFEEGRDRAGFNLVDPPERNTVAVPSGGWAAIRFKADNPGMWFVHCHLETHTTWGLAMGFIVRDGPKASQQLLPPPEDFPPC